jgi:hypothetical protein
MKRFDMASPQAGAAFLTRNRILAGTPETTWLDRQMRLIRTCALEPLAVDKKLGFKVEMAPELPPGRSDGLR